MTNILQLRPVDRKRLDHLQERTENPLTPDCIGYVHTILTQCFLPYRDPNTHGQDLLYLSGEFSRLA